MGTVNSTGAILNPALEPFGVLIGEWDTVGTHPKLPGVKIHGHASFTWLEEGALLLMHAHFSEGSIPTNVAIFGSDNTKKEFCMLYFDERKVSRKCEVTFEGNVLKWWRNGPEFSQRYTFTFTGDNDTMISEGEMSENGTTWHQDLNLTYTRVR